jgi:hypothetical protein
VSEAASYRSTKLIHAGFSERGVRRTHEKYVVDYSEPALRTAQHLVLMPTRPVGVPLPARW